MNLIERARNISLNPRSEWDVIAPETTTTGELYIQYILPLAAIGPLASAVGMSVFGVSLPFVGTIRMPLATVLSTQVTSFVVALVGVYLLSLLMNALAPSFGGQRLGNQALKLAAYAYTPAWIAGVLSLLPSLGMLALLAGLYGLYLLFLGATPLMKVPKDKAIGFTVVTIICAIVLSIAGSVLTGAVAGAGMSARAVRDSLSGSADVSKGLEQFSRQMAAVGHQAERVSANATYSPITEEAKPSSDEAAKPAEVVHQDILRSLLPESFASFTRKNIDASKVNMGEWAVSEAKAAYEDASAKRSIEISISDMGSTPGLMALWGLIEQESDNDQEYMKSGKIDGRPTNVRVSKDHSSGEYSTLIGDRFVVAIKGTSVGLEELKGAALAVPVARLEALKNTGVKR